MGYGALLRAIRKYNSNDYWTLCRLEAGLPFETGLYVAKIMAAAVMGRNAERFGFELASVEPLGEVTKVHVPGGTSLAVAARAAGVDRERLEELNPELRRGRTPPGADPYPLRLPTDSADGFAERFRRFRRDEPTYRSYAVHFGEQLADIAERFDTTEHRLRRINDLERGSTLHAGSTLLVPDTEPKAERRDEPLVVAVPAVPSPPAGRKRVFYEVVAGDRLDEIARFFSVPVDELTAWNDIDPDAELHSGMVLQLYVPPEVDLAEAKVLHPDDVQVLVVGSEEFYAQREAEKGRVRFRYTVRPGDTLSRIAYRFDLSVGDVARINQLARNSELVAGQELIIYAKREDVPPALLADDPSEG
jgi:membrane-bound lytic murein transglycosylase D